MFDLREIVFELKYNFYCNDNKICDNIFEANVVESAVSTFEYSSFRMETHFKRRSRELPLRECVFSLRLIKLFSLFHNVLDHFVHNCFFFPN